MGYTAVCRDFPFAISSHSLPFRSTAGESETNCRLRGGVGMKECFPDRTQEQLYSKPPHFQILLKAPLKMGPRRLPRPPRADGPVHRDITASCVTSGGCIVTPIAPPSPAVAQFPIALLSVRQLAGILHAITAAPLVLVKSGRGVFPPNCPHPSPDASSLSDLIGNNILFFQ